MSSNGEKKDIMQSNLPLLFANGSPASLESMNLMELQYFLLFLLKCDCGRDVTALSDVDCPAWWPSEVPFDDDLLQKTSKKGLWSSSMRKLIQKCYSFHNASFLIEFSRKLMLCTTETNKIYVIDNGDGTRSMKSWPSNKLLVTFRSENQDYDKKQRQTWNNFTTQSPLKSGCSLSLAINASDPRLPQCADLYLCDNCGSDFECLQDVLDHEKGCNQGQNEDCRDRLFNYLRLSNNASGSEGHKECGSSSKVVRPKPSTYAKFVSIDVSSPLGQYICELNRHNGDEEIDISSLCAAERKTVLRSVTPQNGDEGRMEINGTTIVHGGHGEEFPVTYRRLQKGRNSVAHRQDPHVYCFTTLQKAVRMQTLVTGLSPQSLKLYMDLKDGKRQLLVQVENLCLDKLPPQVSQWLLNSQRRRERQLEYLEQKEARSRHYNSNVTCVPKLTNSQQQFRRNSSMAMLQSFTSAVQKLCKTKKQQQFSSNGIKRTFPYAAVNGGSNHLPRGRGRPPKRPKVTSGVNENNVIDLCSSSSDEDNKNSSVSSSSSSVPLGFQKQLLMR